MRGITFLAQSQTAVRIVHTLQTFYEMRIMICCNYKSLSFSSWTLVENGVTNIEQMNEDVILSKCLILLLN